VKVPARLVKELAEAKIVDLQRRGAVR